MATTISIILVIFAFFLLLVFIFKDFFNLNWWDDSPERKGEIGEAIVHDILSALPDEYKLFDDIVLKTDRGTTQIDHIVVSKYGVFAIETKNYRGDIYGDDNRKEWTQLIVTEVTYMRKWYKTYSYVTKNRFYNPVKQAYGHVYEIKKTLYEFPHLKVVPIVVFTGVSNLLNVTTNNHVIHDKNLLNTILEYKTVCLSESDVENIAFIIEKKNVRNFVDNQTHVHNVMMAQNIADSKISHGICPRCGGKLVYRTGRYRFFYGCSNYPYCKFTTH